jgi:hypothetical protein
VLSNNIRIVWSVTHFFVHNFSFRIKTERRGRVVKLLLRILEIPASNLGPETGYLDWGFLYFSSAPSDKFRNIPIIRPRLLPSISFPIHLPILLSFYAISPELLRKRCQTIKIWNITCLVDTYVFGSCVTVCVPRVRICSSGTSKGNEGTEIAFE